MPANLDRPKLVTPTGTPNGGVIVGSGSDQVAHVLVAGTDEMDAVTVEAWSTSGSPTAVVKWPTTAGGTSSVSQALTATGGSFTLIDRWTGNGGGTVYVTGANCDFKVSVERYPAGDRDPATS